MGCVVVDILPLDNGSITPRIAWNSVLTAATLSSDDSVEADGIPEQAVDWLPWTFWRPIGAGPHSIVAQLDDSYTINGWAIAGHDATGTVSMDTWNGSTWELHSEVVSAGDGSVIYLIGDAIATTKLRFRFAEISFLAVMWAGRDMVLPEGIAGGWTDPLLALRADVKPEVSRGGIWLGAAVEKWDAQLSLDVKNVEAEWARDEWLPFLRRCSVQPFFLHWHNVDWPTSACLCTAAQFGSTAFSQKGFVDLSLSFMADPGMDRRITPIDDEPALLLEDAEGALLLEDG